MFGYFIRNAITDRYNLMCYITAHDRQQHIYVDDASSTVGRAIPHDAKIEALKSIGATLNFIYCWIKHFQNNYGLFQPKTSPTLSFSGM